MKIRGTMKLLTLLAGIALAAGAGLGEGALQTHLDKTKNPAGCGGCHQGHGKRGTSMLVVDRAEICFTCHGPAGSGRGTTAQDMQSIFLKRYRHPVVETAGEHRLGEDLPEKDAGAPRHVACQDCHKVHAVEKENPMKGVRGYKRGRSRQTAAGEHEVCYQCHADSANLPLGQKNKADEFDISNASFHPVEDRGRNHKVVSLLPPHNVSSMITCSDCHGNSDLYGPRGPHASDYNFILKQQYSMTETVEGPGAYALCYSCHSRQSILGNESFMSHKEHVVFFRVPCAACHTAHGSKDNPHLIELNTGFARPSPLPSYTPSTSGRPVCYISCHIGGKDVVHDSAFYTLKRWP